MQKTNIAGEFATINEHWRPRVVGALNGQEVKIVKFRGAFPWHRHLEADELFMAVKGSFRLEFRDQSIELAPGEMLVVPRGVEHRPVADEEVEVMLFEPAQLKNTGDAPDSKFTAPRGGLV